MPNPLMQMLRPSREQELADSYIQQIGRGDRTAIDPFERMLGAQEQAAEQSGFAQRYRDIGAAQTEADIYELPEVEGIREDERAFELEKATAPARTQGQYAVRAAESKAAAQNDALQTMLSGGLQPGQRMSITGVGSVGQSNQPRAPRAPASVTNRLLEAQEATRPSGWRRMLGMGAPASTTENLSSVIQEVSTAEGIHPQLIQDAVSAAQANPTATVDQLMSQVDGDDLTPEEREQFLSVFTRLR